MRVSVFYTPTARFTGGNVFTKCQCVVIWVAMRVCGGNMETPNIINGLLMTSIHEKANAMLVGGNHE